MRKVPYQWIIRQTPDGTFGFRKANREYTRCPDHSERLTIDQRLT